MISFDSNRSAMVGANKVILESSIDKIKNFEQINQIAEISYEIFNPYRLLILFGLREGGFQNFQQLKQFTNIKTDGNLLSHLRSLEKQGFIEYNRFLTGRRPITFYQITDKGKLAFKSVIKNIGPLMQFIDEE